LKGVAEGEANPFAGAVAKIEGTWRFQPFVVEGDARAFCTNVAFPLPAKK